MRWLHSITNSLDMNLSKLWEIVEDREACRAIIHGLAKYGHDIVSEQQLIYYFESLVYPFTF